MNYTKEDYRELYNDEEQPFSDLTTGQKLCMAFLVAAILATGLVEHETVSVMQEIQEPVSGICPRFDANGRVLVASIVHASYIQGDQQKHECHYAYRRL